MNSLAIMQPYLFPYIGYFQLINAVDTFVFYDDVNYIKRGWINRNKLLINNEAKMFTIPVLKASQNKLINEIDIGVEEKWLTQFFITLEYNYKKAPHYDAIFELISYVFNQNCKTISELTILSVKTISNFLGLKTKFECSSIDYPSTKGMAKASRLIEICKKNNSSEYINPIGGKELYNKQEFIGQGINLSFIEGEIVSYSQFNNTFYWRVVNNRCVNV